MATSPSPDAIHFYRGDLPAHVTFSGSVAVDTETMGLNPHRDRLCLVQLSGGDGHAHLVQMPKVPAPLTAPTSCACWPTPPCPSSCISPALTWPSCNTRWALRWPRHLHQDRLKAGAHLYRPPRPRPSVPRTARRGTEQAAAVIGLGGRTCSDPNSWPMPPLTCCTACAMGKARSPAAPRRAA